MTPRDYITALTEWKEIIQLEQLLEYKTLELNTLTNRSKRTKEEIEKLIAEMNMMRAEIEDRTKNL